MIYRIQNYNFTGYSAPSLSLLFHICLDIESWLAKDSENIAVIHCFVVLLNSCDLSRMEQDEQ